MTDSTLQFGPTAGTTIRKDNTVAADNRLIFNINASLFLILFL